MRSFKRPGLGLITAFGLAVALAAAPGAALGAAPRHAPDAHIKIVCAGMADWRNCDNSWVGQDVYNRTASGQKRVWTDYLTYSVERDPRVVEFRIRIQNDGTVTDRFKVKAEGVTRGYRVKFFRRTTNITTAVEAGTYTTPKLDPGASLVIKARVIMPCDSWSNCGQDKAARLVTVRSLGDTTQRDAVRFVRKIWECTC